MHHANFPDVTLEDLIKISELSDKSAESEEARIQNSDPEVAEVSDKEFYILLAIQTFVCFVSNGLFPSIATYSSLPYGNTVYHLSATLNAMANPVMTKSQAERS